MSSFVPSFDFKRLTDWDRPHGRYVEKLFIHVHAFSPVVVRASRHEQVEQRLHFVLRVIDAVLQTLPKPLKGLTESAVPADYVPTPTTLQGAVEMLAIFFCRFGTRAPHLRGGQAVLRGGARGARRVPRVDGPPRLPIA